VKYCRHCLVPDTKPYSSFDDERVCGACRAHELKRDAERGINWVQREHEFDVLIDRAKSRRAPFFDVVVPVSGGKDSISQVARLLGRDLRILAVNIDYGIKTEIGRHNLSLVPAMGAALVIYRPEEQLQKRLIRLGLEDFGDPDLLSHTMLHALPLHVALQFEVPLALLGENSAFEYGGDAGIASSRGMTREWFLKFAANDGRDARFVSEQYDIPFDQLRLYDLPDKLDDGELETAFTSYYFPWDSEDHLRIAQSFGFRSLDRPSEGTYRTYVGIDEKINRIHQYLKVLKFGYGRATDHACEDIRNGRMTRDEAKELVRQHDLEPLSDDYVHSFCDFLNIEPEHLEATLERYRDATIWRRDESGAWCIPGHLED
jgi:N-acetyl sugar amidotransferase